MFQFNEKSEYIYTFGVGFIFGHSDNLHTKGDNNKVQSIYDSCEYKKSSVNHKIIYITIKNKITIVK